MCRDDGQGCLFQEPPPAPGFVGACVRLGERFACDELLLCAANETCSPVVRAPFEPFFSMLACTPATDCVAARTAMDLPDEAGCFYSDYTTARTGVLPAVNCEERPHPDACGRGCPCDEGDCVLVSEAHPWGVCSGRLGRSCRGGRGCDRGACLEVRAPADVRAYWEPAEAILGREVCVDPDVCAAVSSIDADAFVCRTL